MKKILYSLLIFSPRQLWAANGSNKLNDIMGPKSYTPPPNYFALIGIGTIILFLLLISWYIFKKRKRKELAPTSPIQKFQDEITSYKVEKENYQKGIIDIISLHNSYLKCRYSSPTQQTSYQSTVFALQEKLPQSQWEELDTLAKEIEPILFAGQVINKDTYDALKKRIIVTLESK